MKIQQIEFDWTGKEEWGFCTSYKVGVKGVKHIECHVAMGEGDKWYWTVSFEDGHEEMIFNVTRVILQPDLTISDSN
jgi:hypothetical protein